MIGFIVAAWCVAAVSFYGFAIGYPLSPSIQWPATLFVPVVTTTAACLSTEFAVGITGICAIGVAVTATLDAQQLAVALHLFIVAYIAIALSTFTWCVWWLARDRQVVVAQV